MQPNPTLYGQQNNNQKIRFIIITSIVAIVVLGIAVWAIVAMVSGKNKNNTTKVDTVSVQDQTDKKQQETEKKSSDVTSTTEGVSKTVTPAPTPAPAQTENKDIPSTGPEEFLPLAMTAGTLVAYLGSRKFAKA